MENTTTVVSVIIAICITTLLIVCSYHYTKRIDYLTTRGYEQVTLPGESGWAWQKVK